MERKARKPPVSPAGGTPQRWGPGSPPRPGRGPHARPDSRACDRRLAPPDSTTPTLHPPRPPGMGPRSSYPEPSVTAWRHCHPHAQHSAGDKGPNKPQAPASSDRDSSGNYLILPFFAGCLAGFLAYQMRLLRQGTGREALGPVHLPAPSGVLTTAWQVLGCHSTVLPATRETDRVSGTPNNVWAKETFLHRLVV